LGRLFWPDRNLTFSSPHLLPRIVEEMKMTFKPTDYLPYDFANRRHIGPSPEEMDSMLEVIGAESLDALVEDTMPESIRQKAPLEFGRPMSEREVLRHMREIA
jgi:glycine dehydrogenase